MHEFLMSLIPWGIEAIQQVQTLHNPALDSFFKAVTFVGEEQFYLLLLPLIYWTLNKRLGIRLAFVFLIGVYLNNSLKNIFYTPRPGSDQVVQLVQETGYAFPSGHTQNSTVLWGFLAAHVRRWFFWMLAAILVAAVAFSRVYLGVHYPQDLLGGFFFGAVYLGFVLWLEKPVAAWIGRQSEVIWFGLAALIPISLALLNPTEGNTTSLGTLTGFGVAHIMEEKWIRFKTDGLWWKRALRFLLGGALAMIAYAGLKPIFPPGLTFRFVRYGCIGLTVGLIAPWAFVRTGLAASEGSVEK